MKLIFKENIAGSEDGILVRNFSAGEVAEVAEKLSKIFIGLNAASVYDESTFKEPESTIKIEAEEDLEEEEKKEVKIKRSKDKKKQRK
jgi:hypothetical protein